MPTITSDKTFLYMDEQGVKDFASQILIEVNKRIANRIVDSISATDTTHTPTAAAVYKAIASKSSYGFTIHTGDVSSITEPRTDTIYLQRDSEENTVWSMYVYDINLGWINIGNTQLDLSNYWSKSDEDVTELATKLHDKLGLDDKLSKDEVKTITKEELYAMIADIDSDISSADIKYYILTIDYYGPDGQVFAPPVVDNYYDGSTYLIPSPVVSGYTPDIAVVKGVMDSDKNITVTYSMK